MTRFFLVATLALLAGPALAERLEVQCERSYLNQYGTETQCDGVAVFIFRSDGPEVDYFLTLRAPDTLCSPVVYTVYFADYHHRRFTTVQLSGGQFENLEIGRDYLAGEIRVGVRATGIVAGCNTGQMHSWAVDISAAPVPR